MDEKIKIGQIVNAVALKGEVKVYNYSDPNRYDSLDSVLVGDERCYISKVRYQSSMVILKFKGIDDRNAAEALKGKELFVLESELPKLPKDTYYIRDLIGMSVVLEDGRPIGSVTNVIQNLSQDLYELKLKNGKQGYIPAVSEFVKDVDLDKKEIVVKLIEGLLDL